MLILPHINSKLGNLVSFFITHAVLSMKSLIQLIFLCVGKTCIHTFLCTTKVDDVMVRQVKVSWWRHQMDTFSALLALCAGNSPVTGEFPSQRPVTWSFDVFFDLRLNKRLSKQSWGWWFETLSRPLWVIVMVIKLPRLQLLGGALGHYWSSVGSCLSHTYHTFEQFHSNLDEVRYQIKIKKVTFVIDVYKSVHNFPEIPARPILNADSNDEYPCILMIFPYDKHICSIRLSYITIFKTCLYFLL